MSDKKLTVIELTCQNIMRLKAVRIRPDGSPVVIIAGRNAAGKSSLLESIVLALGGKREGVSVPIRRGEDQAAVQVDLGEYVVTRTYNPDKLKVEKKDGGVMASPQAVLDDMLGNLTFDPLALLDMTGKEQVEAVKRILGLDFAALDKEVDDLYGQRHDDKIALKALQSQIDAIDVPIDTPMEEINIDALVGEMEKWGNDQSNYAAQEKEVEASRKFAVALAAEIEECKQKLTHLEEDYVLAVDAAQKHQGALTVMDKPSIEERQAISDRIGQAQVTNRIVADAKRAKKLRIEKGALGVVIDLTTDRLQEIGDEKVRAISEADIPVEGLAFDETGLFLNGVPFDQTSQKEQIEVGFGLAIVDNPKIGITLIRNASLLDAESMVQVAKMAEENGVQVWLERVGDEPAAFVIEDGEVVREPEEER